jgi:hypothetical protein
MGGIDGERLLAHHVGAGLERGLALLPVIAGWAADHDDVRALLDDVAPVGSGLGEPEVLLDLGKEVGIPTVDDRELDLVGVTLEVRQMRADGPGSGADDPETELRHRCFATPFSVARSTGLRLTPWKTDD